MVSRRPMNPFLLQPKLKSMTLAVKVACASMVRSLSASRRKISALACWHARQSRKSAAVRPRRWCESHRPPRRLDRCPERHRSFAETRSRAFQSVQGVRSSARHTHHSQRDFDEDLWRRVGRSREGRPDRRGSSRAGRPRSASAKVCRRRPPAIG